MFLRLCWGSRLPQPAAARSLGLGQGSVSGYLSRARAAGLTWPLPEDVDDARLEALIFPPPCGIPANQRPLRNWGWVHRELRRPDVTLALLAGMPRRRARRIWLFLVLRPLPGLGRTAEADDAPGSCRRREAVRRFRRPHRRGRRRQHWRDHPGADLRRRASFTYAEAVGSQKLPDSIAAHVRAFAYFGGAARQTVSDNLKAGITKASFHEPRVNRTYADMARHYRTARAGTALQAAR